MYSLLQSQLFQSAARSQDAAWYRVGIVLGQAEQAIAGPRGVTPCLVHASATRIDGSQPTIVPSTGSTEKVSIVLLTLRFRLADIAN